MKIFYRHIFCVFLIILSLSGCQSVKDGLTGQKKSNSDEFLIEKKNPLVLPAEFNKLPLPRTLSQKEKNNEQEIDLEAILKKQTTKSTSTNNNLSESLEKSILKKIKDN
tara:strand:+ start:1277 stop:1603 length:327 start_codon:yes stop_codon:yes gene_type:complete